MSAADPRGPGAYEQAPVRVVWRGLGAPWLILATAVGLLSLLFDGGRAEALALALALGAVAVGDRLAVRGALRGAELEVSLTPVAVEGEDLALLVALSGTRRRIEVDLRHPWTLAFTAAPGDRGVVAVGALPRGQVPSVTFQLGVNGRLGLARATRAVRVWFPEPTAIGPRSEATIGPWPEPSGVLVGIDARSPHGDELPRGVRPYVPGDARRRVHWKATARHRELMVRETEGEAIGTLVVVTSLRSRGLAADAAATRARWFCEEGVRRGWPTFLVTVESTVPPWTDVPPVEAVASGLVSVPIDPRARPTRGEDLRVVETRVRSTADVLRRLAGAVPGEPPAPADDRRALVRWCTEDGDGWQ